MYPCPQNPLEFPSNAVIDSQLSSKVCTNILIKITVTPCLNFLHFYMKANSAAVKVIKTPSAIARSLFTALVDTILMSTPENEVL